MSQPANQQEKASETIKVRVTPTQAQSYRAASLGNVSQFIREAANERLRRMCAPTCGHKVSVVRKS